MSSNFEKKLGLFESRAAPLDHGCNAIRIWFQVEVIILGVHWAVLRRCMEDIELAEHCTFDRFQYFSFVSSRLFEKETKTKTKTQKRKQTQ